MGPAVAVMQGLADAEWDIEQELSSCPAVTSLMLFLVFCKKNPDGEKAGCWVQPESWLYKGVVTALSWDGFQLRAWWELVVGADCSAWNMFHGDPNAKGRGASGISEGSWGTQPFASWAWVEGSTAWTHRKPLRNPSRLQRNRPWAIKSYFNKPFFFMSSFNFQPPYPNAVISHTPSLLLNCWFLQAEICFPSSELCQAMCAVHKAALKHTGVFSIWKSKKAMYEVPKLSKIKRYNHKYIFSTTKAYMAKKPCEPQHCFVHYIERPI